MKRFIDIHVPISACNLKCHYCYVAHQGLRDNEKTIFKYDISTIKKGLTAERLGGICHFNICGLGETLIPKEIIDITRCILENGHYVMIVTNGTLSNRFDEFCKFPIELKKRLGFKFSFHYLQMKKLNLFEKFNDNIRKVKNNGMSFSIEMTPNDETEAYIDKIKEYCMEQYGALCHITIPRNMNTNKIELLSKHSIDEFYNIWKEFDSELLDFKYSIWGKKRKEYCYAGNWSGLLNIGTGVYTSCYTGRINQNIFDDVNKPINFIAIGNKCTMPHCYNGHSFLSLGTIPEINTYKYSQLRDRVTKNGEHWLNEEMRTFLSERLEDSNDLFSKSEKRDNEIRKYKNYINMVKKKITR